MDPLFNPSPPALVLTPDLSRALKERSLKLLDQIIRTNSQTTFFRESNSLSALRKLLAVTDGGPLDPTALHSQFKEAVPFSNYEDYRPFVDRLLVPHCVATSVQDLLSPGLPGFVAQTSGTSGSGPKLFPKYQHPIQSAMALYGQLTACSIASMHQARVIEVMLDGDGAVKKIPVTSVSSGSLRWYHGITVENEAEMAIHRPGLSVSPFAAFFVPLSASGTFMHVLFAVADSSLGILGSSFSTVMYDAVRLMEDNWEIMIDAIEKGVVPELVEVGQYREVLEGHLKPNPSRAIELRRVTKGSLGWLKEVWPKLNIVRTSASGSYALPIPKLRHHFGPNVTIMTRFWGSTECLIGAVYDASDLNLYKMTPNEFFEFLDVDEPEDVENLSQFWELTVGKKYELIPTTQGGLWRYRHGDTMEVAGFDPNDGQPLIRFVERRGFTFRIAGEFISEKHLTEAILSLKDSLGHVVEFTTFPDDRCVPRCYGFFVELEGEAGPNVKDAIQILQAHLSQEKVYKHLAEQRRIGRPTIQIVPTGVFQLYRSRKAAISGMPMSQMKVPVSTIDQVLVDWLKGKVTSEIVA